MCNNVAYFTVIAVRSQHYAENGAASCAAGAGKVGSGRLVVYRLSFAYHDVGDSGTRVVVMAPNMKCGRWALAAGLLFVAGLFAPTAPTLAAQSVARSSTGLPKIIVSPLDTPAGDPVAESIAHAVSQSLTLMLHLTGAFTIVRADFLDPVTSYHRSVLYYQQVGARIGIFGTVKAGSSGAYTVTIEYWRAEAPSAPPKEFTTTLANIFAVFTAADKLAVDVASAAAGRKLSVGTVAVNNAAKLAKYSIYADGELVARNRSQVKVLSGKRTIIVAVPGPLGDEPVETFHVDVTAGETVTLTLNQTAASGKTTGRSVGNASKEAVKPPPEQATSGALKVTSSPEGATVLLDGKRVGTTPLSLKSVGVGTHTLNLARQFFNADHLTVKIKGGETSAVDVQLSLNQKDPALAGRVINPIGTTGASLLWSAAQLASFLSVMAVRGSTAPTSSFWTVEPFPKGIAFNQMLFIDTNLYLPRIGNRLAGNSLLTEIGDVGAAAAAAMLTAENAPSWLSPSASQSGNFTPLTDGVLANVSYLTLVADALYDAVSAPFASVHTNNELFAYVARHGSLPPQEIRRPHRIIIATGGGSFVRAGYRLSIVPSYLSLEATGGIGAESLSPFSLGVSGNAALSFNPWGSKTGNLRPELFFGVRASTNFSSAKVAYEFGTGNDWIGRTFDIFTRGGVDYDVIGHRWDQFFTMGTRIY